MFGDILRALREEKNISQKDMAEYLQVSRQAYNYYELGKREPSYDTLKVLSDFFEVTTDFLLGKTDVKTTPDKISHALEDDPELSEFWNELSKREDLQLLFKQTRDLSPKDIKQIIRIIKAIEDEEDREY